MKDLAIVIVNYKVKYHIHLCLSSIENSYGNFSKEVWVVDNASEDGSKEFLTRDFPEIHYLENKENLGFSKANNLALKQIKAKYVLLLNPDTLLQEDTLQKCFEFMEKHSDVGGIAVPMYNGKGKFAPESKRGIPTPWVAFTKILRLYKLFPKSPLFGKYYMTHLGNETPAPIEGMSGALMFLRKEVLDKIGFLDETFFMYGEDIDLSYRILQAGYKNYYLPSTRIIHFKGEATDKNSLNYLRIFYNAMEVFVQKHFSHKGKLYVLFLKTAIRSGMWFMSLKNFLKKYGIYFLEISLSLLLSYLIVGNFKMLFPVLISQMSGTFFKHYRNPYSLRSILFKSVFDAFFPATFGIIGGLAWNKSLLFAGGYAFGTALMRLFSNKYNSGCFFPEFERRNVFIYSEEEEARRLQKIFEKTFPNREVQADRQLKEGFSDYVFSLKNSSVREIIDFLIKLKRKGRRFFIASPKRDFIITSKQVLKGE